MWICGVVDEFFHSAHPQDLKWNSPKHVAILSRYLSMQLLWSTSSMSELLRCIHSGLGHGQWNRLSVDTPSCDVPSLSVFSPKCCQRHQDIMLGHRVMSWRHTVMSHTVMCHQKMDLCNLYKWHHQKIRKSRFSKWRPWPVTYDLDLQTHSRYCPQGRCSLWISGSYLTKFSCESDERQTDTHTQKTDFILLREL